MCDATTDVRANSGHRATRDRRPPPRGLSEVQSDDFILKFNHMILIRRPHSSLPVRAKSGEGPKKRIVKAPLYRSAFSDSA